MVVVRGVGLARARGATIPRAGLFPRLAAIFTCFAEFVDKARRAVRSSPHRSAARGSRRVDEKVRPAAAWVLSTIFSAARMI
jgi:pilus assembly protein Flp/PilA